MFENTPARLQGADRPTHPWLAVAVLLLVLAGCAGPSLKDELVRFDPTYAKPPAERGLLGELAESITHTHGAGASGFRSLDHSYDGLAARLALIDSAVSSLDIQTYLWYPDNVGRLILERAIHAANRGVHMRLIVDDLLTIGLDQLIYELDQRPNIEVRLFNPWNDRSTLSRGGEMIAEMEGLNTRMHDKLLFTDGQGAVVGGRAIGDHYFGLSHDYKLHDLDLLGFGHIARQANETFDHFWNSEWVVSAVNLNAEPDPDFVKQTWADLQAKNRAAEELDAFGVEARDWRDVAINLAGQLHIGKSLLVFDEAADNTIAHNDTATTSARCAQ